MPKAAREKFKTLHNVFDEFTNRNLMKLISEGYLDGLVGPVSVGKESNIFSAKKGDDKVIVKIYRLSTCDFNRMYDYIKYDPRYLHLKKQRRAIIFAWAQREYRNLLVARKANVRVPTALAVKYNILVMEFIGDHSPAPKLKDSPPKNPKDFLESIAHMSALYKAGLVHADLSSFNVLNWNEKPVLIDFSQTTPIDNTNAIDFLRRDILNICRFFEKLGLKLDSEQILNRVIKGK